MRLNRQDDEQVQTMIIDTSCTWVCCMYDTLAKLADQQQVDEEIRRAHFICVVYDTNIPLTQTLSSILAWMGRIEKLSRKVSCYYFP